MIRALDRCSLPTDQAHTFLIVSPHLDDALLSAFALIQGAKCETWTVFAGRPTPSVTTDWDRSCGFANSDETMTARLEEDSRAFADLPVFARRMDALEGAYTNVATRAEQMQQIQREIENWLDATPDGVLAVPAGAGVAVPEPFWAAARKRITSRQNNASEAEALQVHDDPVQGPARVNYSDAPSASTRLRARAASLAQPFIRIIQRALHAEYTHRRAKATSGGKLAPNPDHIQLRDLAVGIALRRHADIVVYNELPYLWHGDADERVEELASQTGFTLQPFELSVNVNEKFRRISAYESQMPVMDVEGRLLSAAHIPPTERYWWLSSPSPS